MWVCVCVIGWLLFVRIHIAFACKSICLYNFTAAYTHTAHTTHTHTQRHFQNVYKIIIYIADTDTLYVIFNEVNEWTTKVVTKRFYGRAWDNLVKSDISYMCSSRGRSIFISLSLYLSPLLVLFIFLQIAAVFFLFFFSVARRAHRQKQHELKN